MADFLTFTAGTGLLVVVLIVFARASASVFLEQEDTLDASNTEQEQPGPPSLSTATLLANVALTQGLFGLGIIVLAWYTSIPPVAFGLADGLSVVAATALGTAIGLVFFGLNDLATRFGQQRGMASSEALRAALAPESRLGWVVLLLVVLPIIAGFEELLFRGALIGVTAAGFGLSPWLLAVVSSLAFALGHEAQGRLGVLITGLLGFALAAVFILTGSLLVVIVAHYVINACEFIVHEGLDTAR